MQNKNLTKEAEPLDEMGANNRIRMTEDKDADATYRKCRRLLNYI